MVFGAMERVNLKYATFNPPSAPFGHSGAPPRAWEEKHKFFCFGA